MLLKTQWEESLKKIRLESNETDKSKISRTYSEQGDLIVKNASVWIDVVFNNKVFFAFIE